MSDKGEPFATNLLIVAVKEPEAFAMIGFLASESMGLAPLLAAGSSAFRSDVGQGRALRDKFAHCCGKGAGSVRHDRILGQRKHGIVAAARRWLLGLPI